ncbi:hypothetical protein [Streptomyces anatolicus]|nr:hypothetical protein [Streptomyces anatolicus]
MTGHGTAPVQARHRAAPFTARHRTAPASVRAAAQHSRTQQ